MIKQTEIYTVFLNIPKYINDNYKYDIAIGNQIQRSTAGCLHVTVSSRHAQTQLSCFNSDQNHIYNDYLNVYKYITEYHHHSP